MQPLGLFCCLLSFLGSKSLGFLLQIVGMLELILKTLYFLAELSILLGLQVLCQPLIFHLGHNQTTRGEGLPNLFHGITNQVVFVESHECFSIFVEQEGLLKV